ncbi:MAG: indolepyruvate ferredoxin oxidoreductase [Verrucomicrobia bacterium]|nr:MAG: indolepyruvate ferredoxin oxidoreductase [Verrucomicrobiota bacterium]
MAAGGAGQRAGLPKCRAGGTLGTVKVDPRFTRASGVEVYTGNELLVKGCLETEGGTHLWTGYPGSPVSAFFDVAHGLRDLLRERGIRVTMANNEALAAAMVNGSQMHGLRAITVQKSVGVHVASDALALGNLVGAHPEGGAVIVLGDDPWSDSTQVPADSRFLARHLMMPVLEPSDAQELKDWIDLAFKLSRESELYIGYLVSTNQVDGGGSVLVRPNHFPQVNTHNPVVLDTSQIDLERNVLLPPRTWRKEQAMPERVRRLWESARRHGVNRVLPAVGSVNERAGLGFITSAAAYCYLRHALAELGLDGAFPILKLGLTYPLDPRMILDFAQGLKRLIVVEERRPFLEEQVAEIILRAAQEAGPDTPPFAREVWGKRFPHGLKGIPDTRGLNPSKLIDRLGRLFLALPELEGRLDAGRIQAELDLLHRVRRYPVRLPARTPTFCPGCPHRDSASVLIEIKRQFRDPIYMRRVHGMEPVDLVFHGDTGCYTMLMFEPTQELMHNYSGMGLGGGTGAGIDPFIRNKQVVFMGDSTFFHSGQVAISNSLKNGQDITYIILDNKTTAMTGHQTTPGRPEGVLGEETFAQNIDAIVAGLTDRYNTGALVVRVNPAERETYRQLLEKAILQEGVKVIVADKECGITYHRRLAREERRTISERGFLPKKRFINITEETCEYCLECTKATGCPGLTVAETPFGRKMQIDRSWCVSDGACTRFMVPVGGRGLRVKACPAFEEVWVKRCQPPVKPIERLSFSHLPPPPPCEFKGVWRGYLAGVGGMGIGTTAAILVLAGHRQGYTVKFCDKKGLAIRNGGVYSMITYTGDDAPFTSNLIPYGKADLILGVDLLEAVRAIDPNTNQRVGSPDRTAAVVNSHKTPTIRALLGEEDFDVAELEATLRAHTRPGAWFGDVSELSEAFFGTKLYANIVMVGIAYQLGLLPLELSNLEWAIGTGLGSAVADNIEAFRLGRLLVVDPDAVYAAANIHREPATFAAMVKDKVDILRRTHRRGAAWAAGFRQLVEETASRLDLDDATRRDFALRVYDLIQWEGGLELARRYAGWIERVHAQDEPDRGHAATRAVIWNLHKVMAIKDEIFVAHQLTSEEKRRRDRARFNVDPTRGDRLIYRHLNRPQFTLWGRDFAFNIKTRDWMLNFMKRLRMLRRWLPEWHRKEREFRDWYESLLPLFEQRDRRADDYETWLALLRLPEKVSGYRDIRYPKMDAVRAEAAELLARLGCQPPPAPAPAPEPAEIATR